MRMPLAALFPLQLLQLLLPALLCLMPPAAGAASAMAADAAIPAKVTEVEGVTEYRVVNTFREPKIFDTDEHPRTDTTLEQLAKLKGINNKGGLIK